MKTTAKGEDLHLGNRLLITVGDPDTVLVLKSWLNTFVSSNPLYIFLGGKGANMQGSQT